MTPVSTLRSLKLGNLRKLAPCAAAISEPKRRRVTHVTSSHVSVEVKALTDPEVISFSLAFALAASGMVFRS